ncbi:MAG: hypothetical protein K6E10_10315 [Eubacterium sp.]|nr:hypothetical protein [Eubacterium sp.]
MSLSSGLIYLGICFMILAFVMIEANRKQNKKTNGNKKLNERIIFYKNKWQKEHVSLISAPIGIVIVLTALSCFTKLSAFLYLAGVALLLIYIYVYNKMMIYVEANAFNGKGMEEETES